MTTSRWLIWVGAGLAFVGCGLSEEEQSRFTGMQLSADDLPRSATNLYADEPAAAALGRHLFFDDRMSADGKVACSTCHEPEEGFSDPKPVSIGTDELEGERHSMPITAAALQRFFLWDGRADSLWSQPLKALEAEKEMDFSRAEVAHFIAGHYAAEYEAVFGPLPDLSAVPSRARPGLPAWDEMDDAQRDDVQRVFANTGKALEAYQRRILCTDTRFDRWLRGELELTEQERDGAAEFVREGCIECHAGPAFSDGEFHNIGIGSGRSEADRGRAAARDLLLADSFNGTGAYSDDVEAGAALLDSMVEEIDILGAFRTPSLRGVGQRRFFGHRGHHETLEAFLEDVYDEPHLQTSAVGALDPLVVEVEIDGQEDVAAFLHTLDCPPLPPELLKP